MGNKKSGGNRTVFYSRANKPKLYNALIVALLTVGLIVIYRRFLTETRAYAEIITICVAFIVVLIMFRTALRRQIEYNPYSYNTIIYFGFSLFILTCFISQIYYIVTFFRYSLDPADLNVYDPARYIGGSAKNFVIISAPFLVLFSAALIISNFVLIRREGGRIRNLIGSVFSVVLLAGWAILWKVNYYFSGSETEAMIFEIVTNVYAVLILYCECMLIGTIFANIVAVNYKPEYDKDYIIILGCGINKDGTPRPLLRGRIDRAIAFGEEQYAATGKRARFVVSGGKGNDEVVSEAQSMKNYLIEKGVPESQIILEDKSKNTLENMRFSKEKILSFGDASAKVLFSTSNYHVFRSGIWSNRVKMRSVGVGAKTKWYFWPNAAVREFFGLLSEHRGKQIFILLGLIAVYTALSIYSIKA